VKKPTVTFGVVAVIALLGATTSPAWAQSGSNQQPVATPASPHQQQTVRGNEGTAAGQPSVTQTPGATTADMPSSEHQREVLKTVDGDKAKAEQQKQ
jgi:hypothetical protein